MATITPFTVDDPSTYLHQTGYTIRVANRKGERRVAIGPNEGFYVGAVRETTKKHWTSQPIEVINHRGEVVGRAADVKEGVTRLANLSWASFKHWYGRRWPESRTAAEKSESSSVPGSQNFDPTFANTLLGDLAEEVRGFLADKHDARPPGLQTLTNPDGSLTVVANNPEVGLGIQVTIALLAPQAAAQTPPPGALPAQPVPQGNPTVPVPQSPSQTGVGPQT